MLIQNLLFPFHKIIITDRDGLTGYQLSHILTEKVQVNTVYTFEILRTICLQGDLVPIEEIVIH